MKKIFALLCTTKMLSTYTGSRINNFNLLRLLAACAVLFSHSFVLCGYDEPEIAVGTGITFGTLAVNVFFICSGFLVTGSLMSRKSLVSYGVARFLRVYPALIASVLVTVAIIALFFTVLSKHIFFLQPETYFFILKNVTLFTGAAYTLPGVFLDNPYKATVNGSLWTLPHEIALYFALGVLWVIVRKNSKSLSIAIVVIAFVAMAAHLLSHFFSVWQDLFRTAAMFSAGAVCWILQRRMRMSVVIFISIIILLVLVNKAFYVFFYLLLPYCALYLAYVPKGRITAFNRFGDYSYGVYIYAFPVQQCVVAINQKIQPGTMIAFSLPITLLFAVLSWHLLEARALQYKDRLSAAMLARFMP